MDGLPIEEYIPQPEVVACVLCTKVGPMPRGYSGLFRSLMMLPFNPYWSFVCEDCRGEEQEGSIQGAMVGV